MYLHEKLKEYEKTGCYPMHMPGHKRQITGTDPYRYDITEIEGFDDLHHSRNLIKQDMERAAEFYGAAYSRYLVNGSTCGILAAISAVAKEGKTLLFGTNSHRCAWNALEICGLKAKYLEPEKIKNWGICGGVLPERVREALKQEKPENICGVFLTSPTYEGVISDIQKIAEICHEENLPLIVDEAHGAHLKILSVYGGKETASALDLGADLVIQSLHKTLPAMTQTAILHIGKEAVASGRVTLEQVEHFLKIYQSSSPSYVLMGSISECVHWMRGEYLIGGKNVRDQVELYLRLLDRTRRELEKNRYIRLLSEKDVDRETRNPAFFDQGKLVLSLRGTGLTGNQVSSILRERFSVEIEMAAEDYIIAMTSVFDTEEGLGRFCNGIARCDRMCGETDKSGGTYRGITGGDATRDETDKSGGTYRGITGGDAVRGETDKSGGTSHQERRLPVMSVREAEDYVKAHPEEIREIPLSGAGIFPEIEGGEPLLCADYLYLYPPGIPIIAPGEAILRGAVEKIMEAEKRGLRVCGCVRKEGSLYIRGFAWKEEESQRREGKRE